MQALGGLTPGAYARALATDVRPRLAAGHDMSLRPARYAALDAPGDRPRAVHTWRTIFPQSPRRRPWHPRARELHANHPRARRRLGRGLSALLGRPPRLHPDRGGPARRSPRLRHPHLRPHRAHAADRRLGARRHPRRRARPESHLAVHRGRRPRRRPARPRRLAAPRSISATPFMGCARRSCATRPATTSCSPSGSAEYPQHEDEHVSSDMCMFLTRRPRSARRGSRITGSAATILDLPSGTGQRIAGGGGISNGRQSVSSPEVAARAVGGAIDGGLQPVAVVGERAGTFLEAGRRSHDDRVVADGDVGEAERAVGRGRGRARRRACGAAVVAGRRRAQLDLGARQRPGLLEGLEPADDLPGLAGPASTAAATARRRSPRSASPCPKGQVATRTATRPACARRRRPPPGRRRSPATPARPRRPSAAAIREPASGSLAAGTPRSSRPPAAPPPFRARAPRPGRPRPPRGGCSPCTATPAPASRRPRAGTSARRRRRSRDRGMSIARGCRSRGGGSTVRQSRPTPRHSPFHEATHTAPAAAARPADCCRRLLPANCRRFRSGCQRGPSQCTTCHSMSPVTAHTSLSRGRSNARSAARSRRGAGGPCACASSGAHHVDPVPAAEPQRTVRPCRHPRSRRRRPWPAAAPSSLMAVVDAQHSTASTSTYAGPKRGAAIAGFGRQRPRRGLLGCRRKRFALRPGADIGVAACSPASTTCTSPSRRPAGELPSISNETLSAPPTRLLLRTTRAGHAARGAGAAPPARAAGP